MEVRRLVELILELDVELLTLFEEAADALTIVDRLTPELFGETDGLLLEDLGDERLTVDRDLFVIADGDNGSLSLETLVARRGLLPLKVLEREEVLMVALLVAEEEVDREVFDDSLRRVEEDDVGAINSLKGDSDLNQEIEMREEEGGGGGSDGGWRRWRGTPRPQHRLRFYHLKFSTSSIFLDISSIMIFLLNITAKASLES